MKSTAIVHDRSICRNMGIDLLKIWMCFEVILIHFWQASDLSDPLTGFLSWNRSIAVSSFMLVSFILGGASLFDSCGMWRRLIHRLTRLAKPILFWAVIYFVFFKCVGLVYPDFITLTAKDFLLQLLTGHVYNRPMWFINDLLYLTLLVAGICVIRSPRIRVCVFLLLSIGSLTVQYTGFDCILLENAPDWLAAPAGRIIEMVPYVCLGMILVRTRVLNRLKRFRVPAIFVFAATGTAAWLIGVPDPKCNFGSAGLLTLILTVCVALIMTLLPLEAVKGTVRKIIEFNARLTLGIYCIHILVGSVADKLLEIAGLPYHTLMECAVIYLISLLLCRIVSLIPLRWCRQVVS